jgi:hypothetical protein
VKRTLLNAGIVFGFDALVFGQGFFAGVFPIFVVILRLLDAFRAHRRGDGEGARLSLRRAGIWAAVVVLTLAWLAANAAMAARHADALVAAVRRYEARHQRLPDSLQALVPDFVPAVPRARYTLLFGNFEYDARQGRHSLMYVVIPPFGRQLYIFEQNRWIWLD